MILDEAFFGMARTGTIDGNFTYPSILDSGNGKHLSAGSGKFRVLGQEAIPVPDNSEDFPLWESEDILIIPDGAALIQRPGKLVERIIQVRREHGYGKLLYLQGVSDPYVVPILVYAGISLFDNSTLILEATKGYRYTIFGRQENGTQTTTSNMGFVEHILEVLRSSISSGSLRELVEKYQISSKALEILRLIDNDDSGIFERTFPRRTRYIKANSLESLRRPDLSRYRNYVANDYSKPVGKEVALLLPCSARKPYSTSKSHRKIIDALSGLRSQIHEVIVTSPVGLVPRDLENTYPANSYDIPVIGEWYEDEKMMINRLIKSYFSRNSYTKVVAFITEDLLFIREALPTDSEIVLWDKGSNSFPALRNTLREVLTGLGKPVEKVNQRMQAYAKIAQYQFGEWIGDYVSGCKIVRNYNSEMLVKEGKPVLVFNDRLGKFTINKNSAPWFIENSRFLVEIDDFKPTANVYAVGVLGTTGDVRQEDEVVLHHKGEVRGVGTAKMPSDFMVALKKGTAVKVRN